MSATASSAVKKAKSFHGDSERNGLAQKHVMAPYNKLMGCHLNVKTTKWCAIYVVVVLWLIGVRTLCLSAGCKQQRNWYIKKKRYKARGVTPKEGWIVFYHFPVYDKKAKKYIRKGVPGHTGIVTSVNTKTGYMTAEEGNKKDAVGTRKIKFTSLDIMGFGIPYYK